MGFFNNAKVKSNNDGTSSISIQIADKNLLEAIEDFNFTIKNSDVYSHWKDCMMRNLTKRFEKIVDYDMFDKAIIPTVERLTEDVIKELEKEDWISIAKDKVRKRFLESNEA